MKWVYRWNPALWVGLSGAAASLGSGADGIGKFAGIAGAVFIAILSVIVTMFPRD